MDQMDDEDKFDKDYIDLEVVKMFNKEKKENF
jgi:hypothetical protein